MSPPLSPSRTNLTVTDNVIQARHELHRAIDFGGDAECSAWARKWGETSLEAAEVACEIEDDDRGDTFARLQPKLESAIALAASLTTTLETDTPDVGKLRDLTSHLRSRLRAIDEIMDIEE